MARILRWFKEGYPFHRVAFWSSFVLSVFFLTFGLVSPPPGEIDSSVLIAVGEIFAFATLAAAVKAIEDGKDVEIHHKDTDVTIGDIHPSHDTNPDYDTASDTPDVDKEHFDM